MKELNTPPHIRLVHSVSPHICLVHSLSSHIRLVHSLSPHIRLVHSLSPYIRLVHSLYPHIRLVHSLPSGINTLTIAVKNYAKADILVFWFYPILPDLFTVFQIFFLGLY